MKIRLGFVSNSSASSFTCGICNETMMVITMEKTVLVESVVWNFIETVSKSMVAI